MTWKRFKKKWQDCDKCELSKTRDKIVIAKGTIPCDVLFIGEAPGYSEDTLGKPFVGPAGKLLHKVIDEALEENGMIVPPTMAFTNLVCCIPKTEDGSKTHDPPKECVQACYPRLQEFVELCKPQCLVFVGRVAEKRGGTLLMSECLDAISITHPAAILRGTGANTELQCQKMIIDLRVMFNNLVPF